MYGLKSFKNKKKLFKIKNKIFEIVLKRNLNSEKVKNKIWKKIEIF